MHRHVSTFFRGLAASAGALAVAAATLLGASAPAHAVDLSSDAVAGKISFQGTAYLYVNQGETVVFNVNTHGGTMTARQPDGSAVQLSGSNGTTGYPAKCTNVCTATVVAAQTGVMRLEVQPVLPYNNASRYPQVITVKDAAGAEQKGRLFFDYFGTSQSQYGTSGLTLWAISPQGTQYKIAFSGYSGYGGGVSPNNLGAADTTTCVPAYLSMPTPGSTRATAGEPDPGNYTNNPTDCPNLVSYRLFAEQPDPSMPASTDTWADGRTAQTWLNPGYQTPSVTGTGFVADSGASAAGTIDFTLSGQAGQISVSLDVDGDGTFDGARDVTLPAFGAGLGANQAHWDGLDGQGNPAPLNADIPVKINYTGQDEIHLRLVDLEGLYGGVQLTKLNGPNAGASSLSWDDSKLNVRDGDFPTTPRVGDNVDSTQTPMGGWSRWGGAEIWGWGDQRLIDRWSIADVKVAGDGVIPARADKLSITKTVANANPAAGEDASYTVTVTNSGQADAAEFRVIDKVVTGAELAGTPANIVASVGNAGPENGVIAWNVPGLAAGASATLTYTLPITAPKDKDAVLDNWAYVGVEPRGECDAASLCDDAAVNVAAIPDPTESPTITPTPTTTVTPTTSTSGTPTTSDTPTTSTSGTPTTSGTATTSGTPSSTSTSGTATGTTDAPPSGTVAPTQSNAPTTNPSQASQPAQPPLANTGAGGALLAGGLGLAAAAAGLLLRGSRSRRHG